ncbi:MAG: M3 family oligoendopeptidase [Haliscomenobacter sp.]|nr:M3 family oligoendopeptidase [Haliscomenobacter sp.]MBP9075696.1 M3 family oligoendopeptidase [Haliscomenobacter sp.]MBP9873307.1 M3 family oligoendopeptidase [Haliscomenobacter sp.]
MTKADVALAGTNGFLPSDLRMEQWEDICPYFQELHEREIADKADLRQWILDKSELDAFLSEAFSWRYILLSLNSGDQQAVENYHYAVQHIFPHMASFEQKLNQRLVHSAFLDHIRSSQYTTYLRLVKNAVQLFCEENVPIQTEIQLQTKEYGRIFSQMTIGVDGKQMTLQKASVLLEEPDRDRRQQVYTKINERILQDTPALESLFDELVRRRNQIARNAGFENFRDYAFRLLNRFDYQPEDCILLHQSIAHEILPILDELNMARKEQLELDQLRPWDLNIDASGDGPLHPFTDAEDLLSKGIECLSKIHPDFGRIISLMRERRMLDLESRPGKKPGGYNMPLQLTKLPFIFMNATQTLYDLRTLMHESGHAIHFYLTRNLELISSRRFPSEVSELAAMTMELLSMDHWHIFFPNEASLIRARINQLENVLKVLPWIATIDQFQHWVYTHPQHTREERKAEWLAILNRFSSNVVDYSGLERYMEFLWHKQLHIFEAPFYYIEYGIAQLGAIAIWKRYRETPAEAVKDYVRALKLGHTCSIGAIYQAAGIEFRFDQEYIAELARFVREEIRSLIDQLNAVHRNNASSSVRGNTAA